MDGVPELNQPDVLLFDQLALLAAQRSDELGLELVEVPGLVRAVVLDDARAGVRKSAHRLGLELRPVQRVFALVEPLLQLHQRALGLLAGVETPPLVAMPPDHVLTRSFYLLSDMPGRWTGGKVWIESGSGRVNDGVTTIVIGANDYAGAWAVDQRGRGLLPVTPGGETQREMSFRVGVNLVMHALTGNYKDDQVHLPDIMQRLRR